MTPKGDDANEPHVSAPRQTSGIVAKVVISLVLGGLFALFAQSGGVPLVPSRAAFAQVAPWAVPAYLAALLVMHVFRAIRWRHLIRPIQEIALKDVIVLNWIGFFAIFALPFRLGEMARPTLTKLRHDVPISAGLGTVAVERVIDGLVTSLCLGWALLSLPRLETADPFARALPGYATTAVVVFSCAFIALLVFLFNAELAARITRAIAGLVSKKLGDLIAEKLASMADGLRCLADPKLAGAFLVETCIYWAMNAAGMWILAAGCGLPASFGHGVALMGILAIGILLPAGPGLFGTFQFAVSKGLALYFAASLLGESGAVYVFLLYVTQAIVLAITGIVPLYALDLRFRDLLPGAPRTDGGAATEPDA